MTQVKDVRTVSQFVEEYINHVDIKDTGTQIILRTMAEVIDHQFRILPK